MWHHLLHYPIIKKSDFAKEQLFLQQMQLQDKNKGQKSPKDYLKSDSCPRQGKEGQEEVFGALNS